MSATLDRSHYKGFSTGILRQKLRETKERETRADTMEAALVDAFIVQEIQAVLVERGELIP